MLIYNTTYHVEDEVHDNFLIWLKECFIPEVAKDEVLQSPRLCRILSHHEGGHNYSLQWEVENSTILHRWHTEKGIKYNEEITKIFKDKVVGFPTLMEAVL
ncbi:DUF4286 family protein [Bacteroides sp. 519]|uniref:DUF4286 family protein n=1 Tax=Bacteroides sp. 519 TaxID=2302937 RepID=UPI0013D1C284|nr:DUF4286 family protein [Bacteroides sp. 519]NDV58386.1 DUF4286 family protein [Bacteroides sp. 519]